MESGHGGRQHKYLEHLVKQLAEERGFRSTIEEPILDGRGRVDVSLVRDELRIACQVSVTTTKDWELGSIEKCLAAGYSEVVLVGTSERHVKTLARFIESNLDEPAQGKVRYLTSESIVEYLDSFGPTTAEEQVVRGYKVKVTHHAPSAEESANRRAAIARVIAQSLAKRDG
jgi:hypothetical protein